MKALRTTIPFSFAILALSLGAAFATAAPTVVQPGFNIFTVAQDVEVGKQSAIEVERQIPMLPASAITRHVDGLGARLAAQAPGTGFAYRFKVANLSEINAFALPGGFIYVNRGILENARTEGELAGVMAHEIAHVALRHSTNQASKAYLAQSGIGILGGLLGGKTQTTAGQIVGAVGGFGLSALFLKYSRSAETQADVVGSQIMARAGYDPREMGNFFETMRRQAGSDPGKVEKFLSSHPAPVDRVARVRQEVSLMGPTRLASPVGSMATLHRDLGQLSPAPTMAQLAGAQNQTVAQGSQPSAAATRTSIEQPSTGSRTFRQRQGYFELQYPDNWSALTPAQGYGVTIVPRGGLTKTAGGQQRLTCGVVVNHYVPFDGMVGGQYRDPLGSLFGKTPLEEATSDLVRQVMHANPHLKLLSGSERSPMSFGGSSFSVRLSGRSPVTGVGERVTVVTRRLQDKHVIYMLLVSPVTDTAMLAPSADLMMRSLNVNVRKAHSQAG